MASLTADVGLTDPPPDTVKFTVAPAMGFPLIVSTLATIGCSSGRPAFPGWFAPENMDNIAAFGFARRRLRLPGPAKPGPN